MLLLHASVQLDSSISEGTLLAQRGNEHWPGSDSLFKHVLRTVRGDGNHISPGIRVTKRALLSEAAAAGETERHMEGIPNEDGVSKCSRDHGSFIH